ncbi:MAG: CHAT domain-containing protein [Acidobacteriota bacterium]
MTTHTFIFDQVHEQELDGGASHAWRFPSVDALPADHLVTATVEQRGIDVQVRLYDDASNILLVEMDSPTGIRGSEVLPWIADAGVTYRLEIVSLSDEAQTSRYALTVGAPRPATDDDREAVDLLHTFCRADVLRRGAKGNTAQLDQARERYIQALEGWQQRGEIEQQLWVHLQLGRMASKRGDHDEARTHYNTGSTLATNNDSINHAMRFDNHLAGLALREGRFDAAEALLQRAEALETRADDPALAVQVKTNRALWLAETGALDEALVLHDELDRHWQIEARPDRQSGVLYNLGQLLIRQGRYDEAIEALERSLDAARRSGMDEKRLRAQKALVEVHLRRHDEATAYRVLDAITKDEALSTLNNFQQAELHLLIGQAFASNDASPAALDSAIEQFQTAAALVADQKNLRRFYDACRLNEGDAQRKAGRFEIAYDLFAKTLARVRARNGGARQEAVAHRGLGLTQRALGRDDEALAAFARGTALIESTRRSTVNPRERAKLLAARDAYYQDWIDLHASLHLRGATASDGVSHAAKALLVAEQRRSRVLLDAIGDERLPPARNVPSHLLDEERIIHEALRALGSDTDPETQAKRRRLDAQHMRIQQRIRSADPQYAELTRPTGLDIDALRAHVADGETMLLLYVLGDARSYLFRLGPERDAAVTIDVLAGRDTLIEAIDKARTAAEARASHRIKERDRALADAADALFGSALPALHSAKRLVIVPDGEIALAPFSALRIPRDAAHGDATDADAASARAYLVESHESPLIPSLSALEAMRRSQPDRRFPEHDLTLVADPVFSRDDDRLQAAADARAQPDDDTIARLPWPLTTRRAAGRQGFTTVLPRLPGTDAEADNVAATFPSPLQLILRGFEAYKDKTLLNGLATARYVHIATHAIVNPDDPDLSALVFSRFDEDGRKHSEHLLFAHEVYKMRMAADLVVLSACQTGVGPSQAGAGIQGLAHAFLYAGAPRVLMSLWDVDDRHTATFMKHFYDALRGDEALAPGAALAAAQRAMLADEATAAPVHWAPFVLFGDWAPAAKRHLSAGDPIEEEADGVEVAQGDYSPIDYPTGDDWNTQPASLSRIAADDWNTQPASLSRVAADDVAPYVNGIRAETGTRLPAPGVTWHLRRALRTGQRAVEEQLAWWLENRGDDPERQPIEGVDAERLDQAGWKVLYGPDVTPGQKEALAPLLELRREQAGSAYHEPHDLPQHHSSARFRRNRAIFGEDRNLGFGPADPKILPYYLLLVGDPAKLPFALQYDLDVQYAVGRLHLPSANDYARYAESVVAHEKRTAAAGDTSTSRHAAIFGVGGPEANEQYLIDALVDPLTRALRQASTEDGPARDLPNIVRADGDYHDDLRALLASRPGFLFAAGHGLCVDPRAPHFATHHGALVCGDFYAGARGATASAFTGDHLPSDLDGLITFLFACYGAGVPTLDDFAERGARRQRIAPQPMVSHLAKEMLSRGAQAVVGHIDRVWSTSFDLSGHGGTRESGGDQIRSLVSTCRQLLAGDRIGHAMEYIDQRYAESAAALSNLLHEYAGDPTVGRDAAFIHQVAQDARNYVVIGDPAVRLPR